MGGTRGRIMVAYITHADTLRVYLTGAASDGNPQTDNNASFGNFRSSTECGLLAGIYESCPSALQIDGIAGIVGEDIAYVQGVRDTGEAVFYIDSEAEGDTLTLANGDTGSIESATANKFARISRIDTTGLAGPTKINVQERYNNAFGFPDVSDSQGAAGLNTYRAVMLRCDGPFSIHGITSWRKESIGTRGNSWGRYRCGIRSIRHGNRS
jgi:hypothetical protein